MEELLWNHICLVKEKSPLVLNITNYVVMNNTANALLAAGASPVMAHARSEIHEMLDIAGSLVVNIGTLDENWLEVMLIAASAAQSAMKPWMLDPAGAGATTYRDKALAGLLQSRPTVLRGNASEIIALVHGNRKATKGVDSTADSNHAVEAAIAIREQYGSIVCISGQTDIIINKNYKLLINNGHSLMTRVTGLGCSASAIIGAFIAVIPDKTEAVAAAMALMGVSGEISARLSNGPGSLQINLIDKLFNITKEEFITNVKIIRQ